MGTVDDPCRWIVWLPINIFVPNTFTTKLFIFKSNIYLLSLFYTFCVWLQRVFHCKVFTQWFTDATNGTIWVQQPPYFTATLHSCFYTSENIQQKLNELSNLWPNASDWIQPSNIFLILSVLIFTLIGQFGCILTCS